MKTFEALEQRLSTVGFEPISQDPVRRQKVEANMLASFIEGKPISIRRALADQGGGPGNDAHGDQAHGDSGHGDTPHGDHHGDHTDR